MEAMRSVPELQQVLLEEVDASQRARAHLELSWIAMGEGRRDAAIRHLREALALDDRLAAARQRLRELGAAPDELLKKRGPLAAGVSAGKGPFKKLRGALSRARRPSSRRDA